MIVFTKTSNSSPTVRCLFLLGIEDLSLNRDDLTQHNNTVTIHEGNTGETFTVLEGISNQWLLWFESALSHFVGLQSVRFFHLLTTGFLTHLPLEFGDTASSATAADETDWGVTLLDFVRDIEDLNLSIEALDG